MSLQTKIETKLSEALKSKDKKTYSTLRLVVAAIKDTMIAKKIKDKKILPDNDLIGLLKKMVKQRNDSCDDYKKAGRNELLENEMSEIKIINEFLPKLARACAKLRASISYEKLPVEEGVFIKYKLSSLKFM